MGTVEVAVLVAGILLLAGVFAARASERLRVPALLLFLGLGMLAGSEGPGGIAFDSPEVAQAVGTVCLVVILFSGGLDTQWATIRPVLAEPAGAQGAAMWVEAMRRQQASPDTRVPDSKAT